MTNAKAFPARFVALSLISSLAISAPPLLAQSPKSPPLPTVRQIMDRYVSALGGRQAIFEHRSMTVRTRLAIPARGLTLDRVVYFQGRRSHEVIELPGGKRNESGFDGTHAWTINPTDGATLLRGGEARSQARDADMYYPARILDYFSAMAVVDTCSFEGHSCFHLKGTTKWGKTNEHFYDIDTGLLVGYRFNSSWRGGPGEEREVFSDYRDFGRWKMPGRVEHKTPGGTLTEVVDSVSFDDVADSLVALPDAVKPLLRKTVHKG